MLGPDGETVYALFVRQPDGSVQMQIVPRTGALADLSGLASFEGELGTAPDEGVLLLFTGAPGEGVKFFGRTAKAQSFVVSGSGTVTHAALDATYPVTVLTKTAGVTAISNFGQLIDGVTVGQTCRIVNSTGISNAFKPDGSTNKITLAQNDYVTVEWTGSAWSVVGSGSLGNVGKALLGGSATNATSTTLGGGTASASNSFAVLSGTASGSGAKAILGGAASGVNSVTLGAGTASGVGSFSIGGIASRAKAIALRANCYWQGGIGKLSNPLNGAAATPQTGEMLFARDVTGGTSAILTLDGLPPSIAAGAQNVISTTDFMGVIQLHIEVFVWDKNSEDGYTALERLVTVWSNGSDSLYLTDVRTVGSDIGYQMTAATFSAAVNISNQSLELSVACPSGSNFVAQADARWKGFYL